MWKSSTKVGFGLKGAHVIAWFCPAGNTAPAQSYVDNVSAVCLVDGDGKEDGFKGWNRCYNLMASKFHNEKRALRENTEALALDAAIAKKIQSEMDSKDFDADKGKIKDKGAFEACGESIFEQTEESKVDQLATTNAASKSWYAGESKYDFATSAPKKSDEPAEVDAAKRFT